MGGQRLSNFRVLAVLMRPEGGNIIWGGEKSFIEIAKGLKHNGAEVTTMELSPAVCRTRSVPYRTYELDTRSMRGGLFGAVLSTIRVGRETRCDAIYAYTLFFRETIVPALLSALILRKPLYVSVNDDKRRKEDETNASQFILWSLRSSRSIQGLLNRLVYHFSRKLICKAAAVCFVPSEYVADFARSVLGGRDVIVVGRGLAELWTQDSAGDEGASTKVYDAAYLGRVESQKGIITLIEAWRFVVGSRPDAKLAIMGDGHEFEEAKKKAVEFGIEKNVVFMGYIADERVIKGHLKASKVFIFPSRKEGFANAVAQAMACGLPCVLSDIPELRSIYGKYAVFAAVDDPASFSGRIVELLGDERLRERVGEDGRVYARSLKWQSVASKMMQGMRAEQERPRNPAMGKKGERLSSIK